MQEHRLKPEEYRKLKRKLLSWLIPIFLVFLSIIITTQTIRPKDGVDIPLLLVIVGGFTVVCILSFSRILKKQKLLFDSYRIIVHDNLIIREQMNLASMEIYVSEISSITKRADNNIIIKGKNPQDIIYIPPQLENYEQLQKRLDEIMLIAPEAPGTFFQRYPQVLLLIVFILSLVSISSFNIFVAMGCGVPAVATMVYAFFKGMANKTLDGRAKRSLWGIWFWIIVVTASLIFKLVYLEWL